MNYLKRLLRLIPALAMVIFGCWLLVSHYMQQPGEPPVASEVLPAKPGEPPAASNELPAKPGEPPAASNEPPAKPGEPPAASNESPPASTETGRKIAVQRIVSVADGDTFTAKTDIGRIKVRILGIDAPETSTCGADAATQRLKTLLKSGKLVLTTDPVDDEYDPYGRLLAYVDVDGTDIGKTLVAEGLVGVWWPSHKAQSTRTTVYIPLEQTARTTGVGSWPACGQLGRTR